MVAVFKLEYSLVYHSILKHNHVNTVCTECKNQDIETDTIHLSFSYFPNFTVLIYVCLVLYITCKFMYSSSQSRYCIVIASKNPLCCPDITNPISHLHYPLPTPSLTSDNNKSQLFYKWNHTVRNLLAFFFHSE